jgi:hypothetical protein
MATDARKRKWDQEDENAALKFSRTDDAATANGAGSPASAVDAAMAAAARVAAQVRLISLNSKLPA